MDLLAFNHNTFRSTENNFDSVGNANNSHELPKLSKLCQDKLLELFIVHGCSRRIMKDLYKYVPDDLLDPVFEKFLETFPLSQM